MRKFLIGYRAIKKQLVLSKYEAKRLFGHPLRLLFLLLLFFVFIFIGQAFFNKAELLPTVVLVDEDRSVEVRTFVENIAYNKLKDVVKFQEMDLEEGLALLDDKKAIGLIHIPQDTRNNLDTLSPSEMTLYMGDPDDIRAQFLRGYMEDMVGLLNEGQSGAMVLWREMKRQKMPYDDRIDILEDISFDYGLAFLTRGDVFALSDVKDPLEGMSTLQYYGYGLLWLALVLGLGFAQMTIVSDEQNGIRDRLVFAGYDDEDYLMARTIVGSIFSLICMMILHILFWWLLAIKLLPSGLSSLLLVIWMVVLINGFVVLSLRFYRHIKVLVASLLILGLTIYSSGILIPEFYLPAYARLLGTLNLVNFADNILKGYPPMTMRSLILPIYTVGVVVVYKQISWRARRKEKAVVK
jgi:hypothetical protein